MNPPMKSQAADSSPGQRVIDDIAARGWHCAQVPRRGSVAAYTYTVGLYQAFRHHELVIFGQEPQVAERAMLRAVRALQDGRPFDLSATTDALIDGLQCRFAELRIARNDRRMDACRWYYGGVDFPACEVVWSKPARPAGPAAGQMGSSLKPKKAAPQMSGSAPRTGWLGMLKRRPA